MPSSLSLEIECNAAEDSLKEAQRGKVLLERKIAELNTKMSVTEEEAAIALDKMHEMREVCWNLCTRCGFPTVFRNSKRSRNPTHLVTRWSRNSRPA